MKKTEHFYIPHLAFKEFSVPSGGNWLPKMTGWSFIQVRNGSGYWLQANSSKPLETGAVLLVVGQSIGTIRASQLSNLSLSLFNVIPQRLTGLITLGELNYLKQAASRTELASRVFPANHPVATKMQALEANHKSDGLMLRVKLLDLFVESWGDELKQEVDSEKLTDAKERLQAFLRDTPPDELLDISFRDLARKTHCTSRHLSRIFNELVGMSFREKRAEIRLARACELLASSQSKVVEVAMESGYKSLSLFNLMFTRRFGTSPGKWRLKQNALDSIPVNRRTKNGSPKLRIVRAPATNRTLIQPLAARS